MFFPVSENNSFFNNFFFDFGWGLAAKRHPKTILEAIKNLIKKGLNSGEGLVPYWHVWHYTPGAKFAPERRGFGRITYWGGTFQHASSLSRRKVGGYIYIYK